MEMLSATSAAFQNGEDCPVMLSDGDSLRRGCCCPSVVFMCRWSCMQRRTQCLPPIECGLLLCHHLSYGHDLVCAFEVGWMACSEVHVLDIDGPLLGGQYGYATHRIDIVKLPGV